MKADQVKMSRFSLLPYSKLLLKFTVFFLSAAVLNLTFSCSYFKVSEVDAANDKQQQELIEKFEAEQKYLVVHSNNKPYHLDDLKIDANSQVISGNLVQLDDNHIHKGGINVQPKKSYRYNKKKTTPLNEVHIYLKNDNYLNQGNMTIPISEIERIAVVDKNVGKSVLNIVATTIGVLALLLIIVALTKSSCPFIYSHNGEDYVFNGELYPGNIIRNAQQLDYLKLNDLCEKDGLYKIRISNELLEIQHTDLVEMLVIDHKPGSEVLMDPSGIPLIMNETIAPVKANSNNKNVLDLINTKDEISFLFNERTNQETYISDLILTFPKTKYRNKATLKLSVKNSLWLDYVFGKFNEKFGSYYEEFQRQQQDFTSEESLGWQDAQHIPLKVSVKKDGKWHEVETIYSAGPLSYRDIGLQFDLENSNSEVLEVKLSTGFMFWELDQAAISFIEGDFEDIKSIPLNSAINDKGIEVSNLVNKIDGKYLTQKIAGEYVDLSYRTSPIPEGKERSIFIKTKGYYNYIRDYKGIPDFPELLKFKKPGYFTKFSFEELKNIESLFEKNNSAEYAL